MILRYLMGILNSRLFVFLYRAIAFENARVLAQVKPTLLEQLRIRPIDVDNTNDTEALRRMVTLIDRMIDLQERLAGERNPEARKHVQSQAENVDRQIDHLVYNLYGLTASEVEMVEQAVVRNE